MSVVSRAVHDRRQPCVERLPENSPSQPSQRIEVVSYDGFEVFLRPHPVVDQASRQDILGALPEQLVHGDVGDCPVLIGYPDWPVVRLDAAVRDMSQSIPATVSGHRIRALCLARPAFERYDRLANYDLQQGVMVLANQNGQSRSTLTTNKTNFSPRLGFAYQLTSDGKTVLRGGFAMGYLLQQTSTVGTANERLTANLPFKRNFAQVFDFNLPSHRVSDRLFFPDPDPSNPNGDVNYLLRGDPTPYMEQWNFNVQRSLPWNFMGEVSYVGSHGVHLSGNANLNQAPPGPTASGPRSVHDPALNSVYSILSRQSSIYHGLQTKLQRRFVSGLYLVAGYTFSKSIDDGFFTSGAAGAGSSSGPQDAYDWRAERGPSDFDVTHRFVGSYVYELPWGKGRRFMTDSPTAMEMLLGGWQINGITTLQSGGRFTPNVASPRTNAGPGGSIRPDRIGSGRLSGSARTIQKWFDRSAFVAQGSDGSDPYHFGNSGRKILRGPGLVNFDFSLFKKFSIKERAAIEVRGEFFSLFNTPWFNLSNRSVDVPQGGVISSAQAARQVQLALRLTL